MSADAFTDKSAGNNDHRIETKGKKRKYVYAPRNKAVKQRNVETGLCGLLFTCDRNEKQAVREAYNVIDQVLGQWKKKRTNETKESQKVTEDSSAEPADKTSEISNEAAFRDTLDESQPYDNAKGSDEDIADTLKRFCDGARSSKKDASLRAVRQRPTGVKCCIFFEINCITSENIYEFTDELVRMAQEEGTCRLLHKVWPVEVTCPVNFSVLDQEVSKLVNKHFNLGESSSWPTYSVEFKARNNSSISSSDAIDMANLAVQQLSPGSWISYNNADKTILYQIVRNTAMLSCVKNYVQRRKLSLHKPTVAKSQQ